MNDDERNRQRQVYESATIAIVCFAGCFILTLIALAWRAAQ